MMSKLEFLTSAYTKHLKSLHAETPPLFGKMNVHQMVEHMTGAFQEASGQVSFASQLDEETIAKMYRFMMSDKPFRDNTPNLNLPETPLPPKTKTVEEAIQQLEIEIQRFVAFFDQDSDKRWMNPFFGNLNFEEWTHLLHKHALHHLRQFGITSDV